MALTSDIKQVTHRPGPLKQTNKPHKGGRKGKRQEKGKVDVKTISHRKRHELNRLERKNQLNQLRSAKKEETLNLKRRLGGFQAPPILVTILPIDDNIDAVQFLEEIKSCDDDLIITQIALDHCHISSHRLKQRYTFILPNKFDHHSIMDALKVSEILLLLHSVNPPNDYMNLLFSTMVAHVLPTTLHVLQGLEKLNPKKKAEYRKLVIKSIEPRFPEAKLQQADTRQELQLLLRQIGSQKKQTVGFRDNRFHMLVESTLFDQLDQSSGKGTLKVSGYVRGQPLNVNGLVHMPGWGTYQMTRVEQKYDPHASDKVNKRTIFETSEDANPLDQESLQSEVVPDPMDGEQTWPTQDELDAAEQKRKRTVKRVAEGTSEYQAAWIRESEEDSEDESQYDDSKMGSDDESVEMEDDIIDDAESIANNKDENYDKEMDMDEEKQALVRFKEERMNQMFPDEEDTPIDISARVQYQKYRGLKNFRCSPWDPLENLPLDYAKIYRFQNFRHTKKKVLKAEREGFEPGLYVTIHIKDVPQSVYDSVNAELSTFVVYGLLPHEQKMSVMNCVIQKHKTCEVPIKSKDNLIFHIGFTRFTCKPIFSEHKTGSKFKYERYLPSDSAVVASFFAPVIFPPAPVVVFRQKQNGIHQLVATGSVLDINPNRVIVKRVVLSGHPFRIHKRGAVIRYMFFNKDDINWFKCVELTTKNGRRGHIKESLGTHGHMKCVFDQQLQSMDVVLMNLYKRAFPKWTYNPHVPNPVNVSEISEISENFI